MDTDQLTVVGVDIDRRAVPPSYLADLERAWARTLEPLADSTRRSYQSAWSGWRAYCEGLTVAPLPVDVRLLVGYLEQLSIRRAPNTVRHALCAIASADQLARTTPTDRTPDSLTDTALVQRWLANWSRSHPRAPGRQAAVISPAQLVRVLELARERKEGEPRYSHLPRYLRDRAALVLGYAAGCRVSELCALDVGHVRPVPRGLVITIARSKTDQEGVGADVPVLPQSHPLVCPVSAWQDWLAVRGEHPGPAFTAVSRDGDISSERLTERSLQRMIQARARAAGLKGISAHSLRRSMATFARERGARVEQVQKHGRWRSLEAMGRYVSQRELFEDNPTAGLLSTDE